jgi:hypothetical protein
MLRDTQFFQLVNPGLTPASILAYLAKSGVVIPANALKTFGDRLLYDSKVTTGLTSQTFFGSSPTANGSNVPSSGLAENEALIVTEIRYYTGANATLNSTDWELGISDALTKNGSFNLVVNGVVKLRSVPFAYFEDYAANGNDNAGRLTLSQPVVIPPQQTIEINATWPTASATANLNGRFELYGVGLFS